MTNPLIYDIILNVNNKQYTQKKEKVNKMANTMTITEKMNAIAKALDDNGITLDFDGQSAQAFLIERGEKAKRKGSSGSRKLSDEKIAIRKAILDVLANTKAPMTATEIFKAIPSAKSLNEIIGNIKPMLVTDDNVNGKVIRIMDKKSAKFSLVPSDEDNDKE